MSLFWDEVLYSTINILSVQIDKTVLDNLTTQAQESPRLFLKAHHHMKGD